MQRPIALAVAAVSAVLLTLALPATADRLDEVTARGKIIVCVSDTTPPFSFKRPGASEHVGYDIDLVRAVAKRLRRRGGERLAVERRAHPDAAEGKLDFVATSMTRTPSGFARSTSALSISSRPHAVIVRKSSGITSVPSARRPKASSASASTAGGNLKEVVPSVDIVYVPDDAVAFAALKDGSVDAFPTDESVLRAIVQQDSSPDDYLFLPDFTKSRSVRILLKKGEPGFKDAVNRADSSTSRRPARPPRSSMPGSVQGRRSRCRASSKSSLIEP